MPAGLGLLPGSGVMIDASRNGRRRLVGGLLAAGVEAGLVLLLLYGLAAPALRSTVQSALTSLDLRPPPPPAPPPAPAPRHAARRARAAAPPAPRAQSAPVVAPRVMPLKPPPVIVVAAVTGQGAQLSAGAATAGNGSGAAGQGNGTGAGGTGDGGGDGAELVSGRIKSSDTPGKLFNAPFSGTTSALVLIDAAGKISDCRTQRSSGNATLDALTCRLIAARFRFRPARDPAGRPIAGKIIYEHDWEVGGGFDVNPPG